MSDRVVTQDLVVCLAAALLIFLLAKHDIENLALNDKSPRVKQAYGVAFVLGGAAALKYFFISDDD